MHLISNLDYSLALELRERNHVRYVNLKTVFVKIFTEISHGKPVEYDICQKQYSSKFSLKCHMAVDDGGKCMIATSAKTVCI